MILERDWDLDLARDTASLIRVRDLDLARDVSFSVAAPTAAGFPSSLELAKSLLSSSPLSRLVPLLCLYSFFLRGLRLRSFGGDEENSGRVWPWLADALS